ncbi:uncharacterized protein LOC128989202 [Macrosteles quadrilineatus]|uniref:uncharacterized protein LOC128989202 n=1 Tax=Macrosteles quadrilineatus TaxID=74068 RepID=UPI0023E31D02|nr:uncharacterized protein LOC128989202 [Macrosteles quadrilineatus]
MGGTEESVDEERKRRDNEMRMMDEITIDDCDKEIDKFVENNSDEVGLDCNPALQTILTELEKVSKNQLDMSRQLSSLQEENVANKLSICEINEKIKEREPNDNRSNWPALGKKGKSHRYRTTNDMSEDESQVCVNGAGSASDTLEENSSITNKEEENSNKSILSQEMETNWSLVSKHQRRHINNSGRGDNYVEPMHKGNSEKITASVAHGTSFPITNEEITRPTHKRSNGDKSLLKRSNRPIYGKKSAEDCDLPVVSRPEWLFVSRLGPEVRCEDVKSFVANLCNSGEVICERLETRYKTYSSFKCLRNKMELLSFFIDDEKPDVLCLSEHWLVKDELEFYTRISDLNLTTAFTRSSFKNGGTAIFVSPALSFKTVDLSAYCVEKTLELSGVELHLENSSIIIISAYRSPDGDFNEFIDLLEKCLNFLARKKSKTILLGDLNIHLETLSKEETTFTNHLRSFGLFIGNRLPTRGEACLDTVATNLDSWDYKVSIVDALVADHLAVVMELNFDAALNYHKKSPSSSKPDKNKIGLIDKSWYTTDLKKHSNYVKAVHDRYKYENSGGNKDRLFSLYLEEKKSYRIKVQEAKKKANMSYIDACPNKCKAAWDVVKINTPKLDVPSSVNSPDDFNNFFIRSVEEIVQSLAEDPSGEVWNIDGTNVRTTECTLSQFNMVSPNQILNLVKNFKNSSSPDYYGISCHILKSIIHHIIDPLTELINLCLVKGVFPECLKIARTVPIHKKGDFSVISNYRPISILPVLSKILESIIKSQLLDYFEENNLLSTSQHGFRRGRSTVTALISLMEHANNTFEEGGILALTMCDLSKAFDCVNHKILLRKLSAYGVCNVALHMLTDYLDNRKQIVSLEGAVSKCRSVEHGVPQGSILGPLLFIIHINDLDLDGRTLLFADDSTLVNRGFSADDVLSEANETFTSAKNWFQSNKLKLNEDKTQRILLSLKKEIPAGNNEPVKILGFWLDNRLDWNFHVAKVCSKLSRVICLLRKLTKALTVDHLLGIYHALFHSHLNYGLLLWGHSAACSDALALQKKALRVMASTHDLEHCKPLFKKFRIFTVYNQYIFNSLNYIKQNINLFNDRTTIHHHRTRKAQNLEVQRCRLSKTQKSFPIAAIKLFNSLPADVKSLTTSKFKNHIKHELLEWPVYTLNDVEGIPLFTGKK